MSLVGPNDVGKKSPHITVADQVIEHTICIPVVTHLTSDDCWMHTQLLSEKLGGLRGAETTGGTSFPLGRRHQCLICELVRFFFLRIATILDIEIVDEFYDSAFGVQRHVGYFVHEREPKIIEPIIAQTQSDYWSLNGA
jgi:hypothetical protein